MEEEKQNGKKNALDGFSAISTLVNLGVITDSEYMNIRNRIKEKYGKYLSSIKATMD